MRRLAIIIICLIIGRSAGAVCPTTTDTFKNAGGATNTLCIGGTAGTAEVFQHQILDSASAYAFPAVGALSDALANPTEWTIGANLLGWDATNSLWRRLQVDAGTGTLKTDSSSVTQPVSGTVTANQGGTWTTRIVGNVGGILDFVGQNAAQPANSLLTGCEFNTTPTTITTGNASPIQCTSAARLIVDGSQVTQPVSGTITANAGSGTFTVSGTVTANAGTNLNTSALALDTSVNGLLLGQASTTSGQKGPLAQGAVTTAKPSYTTAQTDPLSLDTSGLLRVSLADTPANTNSFLVTATQSGNWTSRIVGNAGAILDFAGQNVAAPANELLTGCAFNTTPTTVTSGNATQIQCDNVGNTLVKVNVALPTGTNTIGKIDILGNAGATLDGTVAAGAAPTNGVAVLGQYNTTVPAPTAAQTVALQTNQNGYLLAEQGCAGQSVANTNVTPFSLASTTALKLVSKVAAKKVYICALDLVSATAQNVALVEGTLTTTNCDTSTAGLAGGTTAATGWNLAANGGLTKGNGQGVVYKSATANLDVCLFSSSTGQISGAITWAQF